MAPIPALTSVRFFAALFVVLFHYVMVLPYPAWFVPVAWQGQAGVAFFFVLSGFILTYNYQAVFVARGAAERRAFWWARFARVYPLHLLALLAATPVALLTFHRQAAGVWTPELAELVAATWVLHLLALQAWLPSAPLILAFNAPSWSISAEAAFYLAFPLVVVPLAAWRDRPGRYVALIAGAVVAGVAIGCGAWAASRAFGAAWPQLGLWFPPDIAYKMWVPARAVEFLIGCALGSLFLAQSSRWTAWLASRRARDLALAAAIALAYAACWLPLPAYPLLETVTVLRHELVFVPASALVILVLASGPTWASRPLAWPALVLLGEASYALYMIHYVTLQLQIQVLRPTTALGWATGIGASLVLSIAVHLWFERPARRWLRPSRAR